MKFEKGFIYHIYNQGNNRKRIFYDRGNYLFFLQKIKTFVLPYTDILAWCLMPNHFHLMVYVRETEIEIERGRASEGFASSEALARKYRTLNQSIGIMLRSYTVALNKQKNWSGSLFRQETKAECVNCSKGLSPNYYYINGIATSINIPPEKQYPKVCFDYIHQNPVKIHLVKNSIQWEFSSASDYYGKRGGKLINKELSSYYGLI